MAWVKVPPGTKDIVVVDGMTIKVGKHRFVRITMPGVNTPERLEAYHKQIESWRSN